MVLLRHVAGAQPTVEPERAAATLLVSYGVECVQTGAGTIEGRLPPGSFTVGVVEGEQD